MGSRGPIGKGSKLRLLTGNPGKRASRPRTKPKTAGVPSPPSGLDRVALAEWRRVVPLLEAEGLLSRLDRGMLAAYCATYARMLAAETALADGAPLVGRGSHGGMQPRPEARIARDSAALLVQLGNALGLSPAGRARLGAGEPPRLESGSDFPPELADDPDL